MSTEQTPTESTADRRLLYCHCAYSRVVPKDVKAEVLKGLAASGRAFDAVPDLCELAARCDPGLKKLADTGQGEVDIVACYPRAVRWLFHAAESSLPDDGVSIHNMRTDAATDILGALGLTNPSDEASEESASQENDASPESTSQENMDA